MPHDTVEAIMKYTGATSQRDLAKLLGVSQNCVWQWFHRGRFSPDGAIAIANLSHGKLKALDLISIGRTSRKR